MLLAGLCLEAAAVVRAGGRGGSGDEEKDVGRGIIVILVLAGLLVLGLMLLGTYCYIDRIRKRAHQEQRA